MDIDTEKKVFQIYEPQAGGLITISLERVGTWKHYACGGPTDEGGSSEGVTYTNHEDGVLKEICKDSTCSEGPVTSREEFFCPTDKLESFVNRDGHKCASFKSVPDSFHQQDVFAESMNY